MSQKINFNYTDTFKNVSNISKLLIIPNEDTEFIRNWLNIYFTMEKNPAPGYNKFNVTIFTFFSIQFSFSKIF